MNTSGTANHYQSWCKAILLCLALSAGLVGCGGAKLASVTGTVTCKGEAVKGGTLIFSPIGEENNPLAGQAAAAEVKPDGSFTLGTRSASDGAQVGRHRVLYTPPQVQLTEEQRHDRNYEAPPPPYMGLVANPGEVQVGPGKNTLALELMSPGG